MARLRCFILFAVIALGPLTVQAQTPALRAEINKIITDAKGTVGVAMKALQRGDTLTVNGTSHFPMQSVFKFPLAMAILHLVDQGKLSLNDKIHIRKREMPLKTWSPIRTKYPEGNVDLTIAEILKYTVSQSDNIGCDMLFAKAGGTRKVQDYIHSLGVKGIAIVATEAQMAKAWNVQYTNWCEPVAMLELLEILHKGTALSKSSNAFLMKIMEETTTCPNRMRGLIPADAIVAHKTGTSDTNSEGLTAATNDVGILTLPNGQQVALVIFVSNSTANDAARDLTVARITKAVWDAYGK
jgi:beta-lactamase class A